MDISAYFFQYLRRVWWVLLAIIVFIALLLNKQYVKDIHSQEIAAMDAAVAADTHIELVVNNLKRSSAIFTLQFTPLIAASLDDEQSRSEIDRLIKQYFNGALSFKVNKYGDLANNQQAEESNHLDIVNQWQYQESSGEFSIFFDMSLISDILNFHQPENYRLLLVDQLIPQVVEVTVEGAFYRPKSEVLLENTLQESLSITDVKGTNWSLVMVLKEGGFLLRQSENFQQIVIISMLFIAVFAAGLWLLSKKAYASYLVTQQEHDEKVEHENMLHSLVEGTSSATGDAFFFSLVKELSGYMKSDIAFIALKSDDSSDEYSSVAFWAEGSYQNNKSMIIANEIFESGSLRYLQKNFSLHLDDKILNAYDGTISGFLASQLFNNRGEVTAVLVVMSLGELNIGQRELAVMKIFASRAEAEISRKKAEVELIEEKERAQRSLESIADGVITTNVQGEVDFMNPVAERLTGWNESLARGLSLSTVFHLEDEETGHIIPDPAMHCIKEERIISPKSDNVLVAKNSNRYSIQGTASPMFGLEHDCIGAVIVFNDVTASRQMEKMMVFQASHDALTGLVNRTEFENRLNKLFISAKEYELQHVLLYLDLDQFKIVNDTAGHIAGDELLVQIANLLLEQLRSRDTLARLGGDEFSVLLEHCPLREAELIAQSLIDAIKKFHFIWDNKSYQVGVSIGLVPINSDSLSTVQIMTQADLACYTAKDKGRGQAHVYIENDAEVATRHRDLLRAADLQEAVEQDRFELMFQPIIDLTSHDEQMHGEVLLRLLDDNGEHVLPGAFIPAAERYGIMDQIDKWVLTKIFNDYQHIFEQNPNLLLSINLSGNSLSDDSLLQFILDLFASSSIDPNQICFEVTETAAISSHQLLNRFIKELKVIGCTFSLDDFGSGLSSFNYLKTMSVDYLKIDGHFVKDLCDDAIDRAMVNSINEMGHILGIKTIAECADNEDVVQILKGIGVDYAQGYYLGDLVSMDHMCLRLNKEDEVSLRLN